MPFFRLHFDPLFWYVVAKLIELFFFLSFRPASHKNVMEINILYSFKCQDREHPFSEIKTKVKVEILYMLQNYKM